ncbi:hypothetical protein KC644_04135 [Candidatus Berkelbacteria bacterium]|nr:hypothetical protein [Candidatus Berkelbacteria bacterium]
MKKLTAFAAFLVLLITSTTTQPARAQEAWLKLSRQAQSQVIGTYYGQSGDSTEIFCFNGAACNRYIIDTKKGKLYRPQYFHYDRLWQELILWNSESIIRAKILSKEESDRLAEKLLSGMTCLPQPITGSEARNEPRSEEVFEALKTLLRAEKNRGALKSAAVKGPDGYITVWLNSRAGLRIFLVDPNKQVIDWITQFPPGLVPELCLTRLNLWL